ncbi:MAG: ketopantoate reductase family protein [Deltaproteobacteria bacterium]|nr:ketopantoate reductase family protein [Deltaproteobacteria bacterium]MBW1951725.1 ketopantoate reductase family protein [Deltaproteobacteria bacterium]MBW1987253.1 ketopantoate reductase family protein [Deltaproteobacteria bacterium]MBW2134738.1 ketopantoate reductase family protein [Deltaproteobacteria bacterium]
MRYLIMGTGALGTVFGGLLQHAGHQVTFGGRGPHFEHLITQGLTVNGIWGQFHLGPVAALQPDQPSPDPYDIILLCVKSFDTLTAARAVKGLLAPNGLIVSVQNGLGNIDILAQEFGAARTIGARVIFGAEITKPGVSTVTVYADRVLLGATSEETSPAVLEQLAADLNRAGIPTAIVDNILTHIWDKVLYNCALNPLGAILGVAYGALADNPATRDLMLALIQEIYQVAAALAIPLSQPSATSYFQHFLENLVPPTAAHLPSMLQDLRRGRRTEIDALNGAICRYADQLGLTTPYNQTLCHLIRFLEAGSTCQGEQKAEKSAA